MVLSRLFTGRAILHTGNNWASCRNISRPIVSSVVDVFKKDNYNLDPELYRKFPKPVETHDYDYLIVGGGSAGSVLAWRLLQEGKNRVGIVELGAKNPGLYSKIPAAIGFAMHSSRYTIPYYTVPQKELKNRSIYWPRGKGMGGSSAINGMVFVRGHPEDYDSWEKLGASGWSYKDVLPYFMKSENVVHGCSKYRGKSGPMKLSRSLEGYNTNLIDAFLKAGVEAGHTLTSDFNDHVHEGFGFYDQSIHNGVRLSSAQAYCPESYRYEFKDSINVLANKKVERVLFDGDKAIGVECSNGSKFYARKEVIISAGAIETPLILMRSGIGCESELKSEGIPVKINLPGVGKNMQDHLEFYIQAATDYNTIIEINKTLYNQAMAFYYWSMHGEGPLTTSYLDAGAFIKSKPSVTNPDIQLHFFPSLVIDHGKVISKQDAFQIHAGTMRPASTGTISLKNGKVVIDPKYLSEKSDLDNLIECLEVTNNLMQQPSLRHVTTSILSKISDFEDFVRSNAETAYHPSCTCKMGADSDSMAVLDPSMNVRGTRGLRVVDASSMPSMVSANLNATVVMMAEKASDMILTANSK